jgi:NAD+ synthase (glutamine-hydrolysing)
LTHIFFIYYLLRNKYSIKKLFFIACHAFKGIYDNETIKKWLKLFIRRFFTQQFKRSCLPDGVKVGSVSLSPRGDFKMPSDATYQIWLDELENL